MANTPIESTVEKTSNTAPQNKSNKKKAVPWDRNGVDGGSSSVEIVLEWLTTGSNYPQWRGDLEEGKTKKSLCSEIIELMQANGIYHRDAKGITQRIGGLQSSYNTAQDWKRNTGAGILESDLVNGVKTVEDHLCVLCRYWDMLDPIMGSRSVAEPLCTRSSVLATHNAPSNHPSRSMGTDDALNHPTSGQDAPSDPEDDEQKKKKKQSSTSLIKNKSKGKKSNPKDFYMKSVLTKRQAEMTKAQAEMTRAWAEVTNAKVFYMKQLQELGLPFEQIEEMVNKEFPPIPATQTPNMFAESNSDDSDSDKDSF
ncbi:hypothetical protein PCASD_11120 [Puccinia coronata f. sp. avenae]|uniref:Uncharacterized protein n=1 Tax=Puccinia coronata f. sp. avenae TaxID=200324 RepID=A0A2N5UHE3_9BASI|nr:hypothetical protein PCASD_11120 [Puccinia coronata f. sp. avenae]